jgi:hypothetical protein
VTRAAERTAHVFAAAREFVAVSGGRFESVPYNREIAPRIEELAARWEAGEFIELLVLLPGRTDTRWFRRLAIPASRGCFLTGRLTFDPSGRPAPFPSAILYLGDRLDAFCEAFWPVGLIYGHRLP